MTTYIHRTMIVTAAHAALARTLAVNLAGEPAEGMWLTALAPAGGGDPTHYVSAGMIESVFADLIVNPNAMHAAYLEAGGSELALSVFEQLVASSIVSDMDPFDVLSEHGLQLIAAQE